MKTFRASELFHQPGWPVVLIGIALWVLCGIVFFTQGCGAIREMPTNSPNNGDYPGHGGLYPRDNLRPEPEGKPTTIDETLSPERLRTLVNKSIARRGLYGETLLAFPEIEEACQRRHTFEPYVATSTAPAEFLLFTANYTFYCAIIHRDTGYITLSVTPDDGWVRRDNDGPNRTEEFRWCRWGRGVEKPLRMTVRSLTSKATFRLRLERSYYGRN